jgi:FkbM family methyltransferase
MTPLLHALRVASHPLRRRMANSIYTPPTLPPEMTSISFSAWGEDVIAVSWLRGAGFDLSAIRYLDVGAAEPKRLSNTYLLYSLGARGVLVEPDPAQVTELRSIRPRDTVISAGVAFDDRRRASLARMKRRVFNTFLDQQVDAVIAASAAWPDNQQGLVDRIEVDLIPIDDIIVRHLGGVAPHFLSIDCEGCDFAILQTLDLSRFRPNLICIEGGRSLCEYEQLLGADYYRVCQTPDNFLFWRVK